MKLLQFGGGLVLIFALGCDSATTPGATGDWGGPGANLTLGRLGGQIEMDCANGTLDQYTIGNDGRFSATGDLAFEGGPAGRQGFVRHPAVYAGRVGAISFLLTVHVTDLDLDAGPFTLERDRTVLLTKCY